MHTLYDTRTVHPLDRYEYYRTEAAAELAPVSVHGRSPGQLLAMLSTTQIGDFGIEVLTWATDREIVDRRTKPLIRAYDPECYRILLSVTPGVQAEQADHLVDFRARDIALYDTSLPGKTVHPTRPTPTRMVMLTFPQALVPLDRATIRPLLGTVMPRNLPGRSLMAQFLIGLTEPAAAMNNPSLAQVLYECSVGLIRQRLGQPTGTTPYTRRVLHQTRINGIIRQHLSNPDLDPEGIAKAAHISPRYLHSIFQDAGLTPMQLLKRLRLQQAHQSLRDPRQAGTPIKEIMSTVGYDRADQFARDFRQQFGVSPKEVRQLATDSDELGMFPAAARRVRGRGDHRA